MNRPRNFRMSKLSLGLVAALVTASAFAQSTSSGVGGLVTDASGAPVSGAEVTITHVESGTVSRATTDASGRYSARGLRPGGPYTVTITSTGGSKTEEGVYLQLNQVGAVNASLGAATTDLGTVAVTASRLLDTFNPDNKGVGTSISGRQLELTPQSSRSLDDVARLDPRISVTDQASGAISVAGVNNRFNSISVDGLSQGDPFGLNANGMPYVGSPISVEAIAAYDLKVSDYDVASDTVGATVNAATKSGTNEFHGSVYYAYKDAGSMVGSRDGEDYDLFDKDDTKGLTIGGPIVKDKLFFFASYEEQEITQFGGKSTSDGVATGAVSLDEVNEAIAIAESLGLQPGTYGSLGINLETKRYLGKIDWNINDYHRLSLTYQQTEESRPSPYDQYADTVVLSSHWYNIDNVTKNTSLQLFSDWTDNFSTEAKVSYQKFDQINGNAINQPEVEVETSDGSIFIGEDDNRHENQINTERLSFSLAGTYYAGDHAIKGGVDYMRHDVFNLYGKALHGAYVFDSLEDFANGDYSYYTVKRPADGYTEADTAAAMVFTQISPFIQDTWQVTDNLSLQYGLRVNIPKADSAPAEKAGFEEAFGFSNAYKLGSSNKVVLPRFSFNYTFNGDLFSQLRGGIGLFQSVPPFVWIANPYQNNGVTATTFSSYDPDAYPFSADPYNQNVPADLSVSGSAQMDVIDPDFKLPSVWKVSLGYDHELPWHGLVASAEILHLRNKDAIYYKALNIGEAQGTLFDGRNYYYCALGTGTNGTTLTSNSNKNCGLNSAYGYNSTLLTNTDQGKSTALTFSLNKPMSNGWYGNLSYTYTKATEVGSDSSSTAWSSYQYVSRLNPNDEYAATASREVRDSIKLSLGWEHAFFGDYKTSITAYYNGRSGLPYTWIINGDANGDRIYQDPAYIPLYDDPNVSYVMGSSADARAATAEEIAAFQAFIDSDPYLSSHRGRVAGRNDARMPWVNQLDLGIQQELPGFFKEHKSIIRLDVYNVLNMLNKDWGVTHCVSGCYDTRYLAGLNTITADGTYVYNLQSNAPEALVEYDASSSYPSRVVSRWSLLLTLKYEF